MASLVYFCADTTSTRVYPIVSHSYTSKRPESSHSLSFTRTMVIVLHTVKKDQNASKCLENKNGRPTELCVSLITPRQIMLWCLVFQDVKCAYVRLALMCTRLFSPLPLSEESRPSASFSNRLIFVCALDYCSQNSRYSDGGKRLRRVWVSIKH
jgi:hypothetical protein